MKLGNPTRIGISGLLLWLISALALAQTKPSVRGLPGTLSWQNTPRTGNLDNKNVLTISANAKTDWFVDPFDGTVAKNAPILLFTPGSDYVLSTQVTVKFASKWDAGALMVWGDDHHWAKLSFELSPDGKPTLVTVVTRELSDDCNSLPLTGESVHLRIAKSVNTNIPYTFPRTDKAGKSFAPLASTRKFLCASDSNHNPLLGLARPLRSPTSRTIRIAPASSINSCQKLKRRNSDRSLHHR
jgi:regulation of enolase protein 1 (concanavalin A-like superfamily)